MQGLPLSFKPAMKIALELILKQFFFFICFSESKKKSSFLFDKQNLKFLREITKKRYMGEDIMLISTNDEPYEDIFPHLLEIPLRKKGSKKVLEFMQVKRVFSYSFVVSDRNELELIDFERQRSFSSFRSNKNLRELQYF